MEFLFDHLFDHRAKKSSKSLAVSEFLRTFAALKHLCGTADAATGWWHLSYLNGRNPNRGGNRVGHPKGSGGSAQVAIAARSTALRFC